MHENVKTFVIHVATLPALLIDPIWETQLALLFVHEIHIEMPPKYFDYADVFSLNLVMDLPKDIEMNNYVIKLEQGKQPPYNLIYSLGPGKMEIIKTYIEIYPKTGFIQTSISSVRVSIFLTKIWMEAYASALIKEG